MRKSLCAVVSFVCLLIMVFSTSCAKGSADIQITGYVSQEIYNTMGMGGGLTSPYAYRVSVEILNKGAKLTCSSVVGAFIPEGGKALSTRTMNVQEPNWVIASGKKQKFNFSSDGYTTMLLLDANDKPLKFFFIIEASKDEAIAIFSSTLPPFSRDLPQYERLDEEKGEYGLPLVFTRVK